MKLAQSYRDMISMGGGGLPLVLDCCQDYVWICIKSLTAYSLTANLSPPLYFFLSLEVRILFEECFYNSRDESYQVFCLEQPLEGTLTEDAGAVVRMESLQDCCNYLWGDPGIFWGTATTFLRKCKKNSKPQIFLRWLHPILWLVL